MIPIILFLFAIVSAIVIIIPAESVTIDKEKRGFRRITKRGYWFFIAVLFLLFLPVIQYKVQEASDIEKEANKKIEQDKNSAILKHSYDSSLKSIVSIISNNLGKYGYQLDSSNNRLIKVLRDSSKMVTVENEDPIFYIGGENEKPIDYLGFENGGYKYNVHFMSIGAACTGFKLQASCVVLDSVKGYLYAGEQNYFSENDILSLGQSTSMQIRSTKELPEYDLLYIWFRGTYTNLLRNKTYRFDEIVDNGKQHNSSNSIGGETRRKVIATVNAALKK